MEILITARAGRNTEELSGLVRYEIKHVIWTNNVRAVHLTIQHVEAFLYLTKE